MSVDLSSLGTPISRDNPLISARDLNKEPLWVYSDLFYEWCNQGLTREKLTSWLQSRNPDRLDDSTDDERSLWAAANAALQLSLQEFPPHHV